MPFIKQDYRTNYIASSEGRSFYKQALRKNKIKAATITSAVGYLMMSVDELKADRKGNGDLELEVAKLRAQVLELEELVQKMASTKVMTNLLKSKRTKVAATEDSP